MLRALVFSVAVAAALACVGPARADLAQDRALAARYTPVVRLVGGNEGCGPGLRYVPIDVNLLFGEPTVALRGPWGNDLVEIAPKAKDLGHGLYGYHLDFPGNALHPGCDYLHWQQHLGAERTPTAYAHVVTDPAHPGKLALQYWFFYVFNDWNNLHEGDWEMIQLVFDAADGRGGARRRRRSRSATASTRAPSGLPGTTRSSSASTARTRSSTRPTARTRTSTGRRSISAAQRAGGRRLRRHARPDRRRATHGRDDPE